MTAKRSVRIDDQLAQDIKAIAAEQSQTETQVIETALKYYRDYYHMQFKATLINEQILGVFQATVRQTERSLNLKTNSVLSELAIQTAIQNFILAENLEVSDAKLSTYRLRALDFLKTTNRVLRLDEVANE